MRTIRKRRNLRQNLQDVVNRISEQLFGEQLSLFNKGLNYADKEQTFPDEIMDIEACFKGKVLEKERKRVQRNQNPTSHKGFIKELT